MATTIDEHALAMRFGQVCRNVFSDCTWEQCEDQARRHWELIRAEFPWEQAQVFVRKGWEMGPPVDLPA